MNPGSSGTMRADAQTNGISEMGWALAAFILFSLLTAALFWPWAVHPGAALIGPPEDNLQDFWNSWYAAVASTPGHFFQTNLIRYPEGVSLYYHSFAYPQVFLLVMLSKIVGTDHATLVTLQNLTLLLSFPVAGAGAFALARHFTGNAAASLIGGFVFAFNPSHVMHVMHHAHVSWIGFIPFFVLAYLLALERKSWIWLATASVLYALCALSCWYYFFYLLFFIVFHLVYLRVRDAAWPRDWRLFASLACIAGAVLLLAPLIVPMALLAGNANAYNGGTNFYIADLAAYFTFPPTHLLANWVSVFYAKIAPIPWEGAVYLGLVNVALLAWLSLRAWRIRDPLLIYVLCGMLTFCVFASGETLHAFGHDLRWFHLPDIVLSKLPFFANVRTPSRAIVMVYLFLSIGVAHGFATLWREHRSVVARVAAITLCVVLVLDFYPAHLAATDATCPKALDFIRNDNDRNFAVLDLPTGYIERNVAMFRQTCHGRPVVQGNVSRELGKSLVDRLETRDLAAQHQKLANAHVKYIILTDEKDGLFVWQKMDGAKAQYGQSYPLAYRGDGLTILRVY
jgi:hypothetical protein